MPAFVVRLKKTLKDRQHRLPPDEIPMSRPDRVFHLCLAASVVVLAGIMVASLALSSMSMPTSEFARAILLGTIPVLATAWCLQRAGYIGPRNGALMIAWSSLLGQLLMVPMYAAARMDFPLRDDLLRSIDHRLGLEVPAILAWMKQHRFVNFLLASSYDKLLPLIFAATTVPALLGKLAVAKEYIVGNVVAVVLAFSVFALCPAIGPWSSYHFTPSPNQILSTNMFRAIRSPGPFVIDPLYSSGLITFPSFHVILAIIATNALCSIRVLRIPTVAVCVLISASALSTGWHYTTDVLGGIVFACISIAAAKAFVGFIQNRFASPCVHGR